MGSGKGAPEFWVVPRQAGPHHVRDRRRAGRSAREALTLGAAKLPIKTKIVARLGAEAEGHDEGRATSARRPPTQLKDELLDLRKEQFNLRFQQATGQLEDTARAQRRSAATSRG